MKTFLDESGRGWVATAHEEDTPRHHGRWYLVLHADAARDRLLPMPEVRWQTRASAQRTLATMSEFELRRRLQTLLEREGAAAGASPEGGADTTPRARTSASAG